MADFVLDVFLGIGIVVAVGLFILMALTGINRWF
jgi:hypothetical protein